MLDDGEKTYYSIILLKIDVKKYILVNYFWKIFLRFISFFAVFIVFSNITKLSIFISFLYSIFNIMLRNIFNRIRIEEYKRNTYYMSKLLWPVSVLLMGIAFILPIFKITISITIFEILSYIVILYGIYCIYKIIKFDNYYKMYKNYLNPETKEMEEKMQSFNRNKKSINVDNKGDINKKGVQYLNSVFIQRYKKKMLMYSIIPSIFFLCLIIGLNYCSIIEQEIHQLITTFFDKIIYIIDCILIISIVYMVVEAFNLLCFQESDYALLNYNSFRNKEVIKKLFKERFLVLLKINLPVIIISSIGTIILAANNIENNNLVNYAIIGSLGMLSCVNIIINQLLFYYIFQPFAYNPILKRATQSKPGLVMINYFLIEILIMIPLFLNVKFEIFGISILIITLVHIAIAYLLLSKVIIKTFKIKK